ncbi:MAG: small ribosomal subunit biogenesis GTPase RsgA [Leptolyngbyaceae cyanobacterium SL_5_9]|nr:small ribosomal subunit biogenesis GTPase RsgA [Leptolyngbyaceae cyanobacterium SL_5_9]
MSAELDHQPDVQQSENESAIASPEDLVGTVLAVQANYYWVQLGEKSLLCTRRSLLKKIGQQVWVGDRVQVEEPDWAGGRGAIAQVFPRDSELDRPPVANADQILLVFALADPTPEPLQLSRFLIKAESTGLEVCLGLNKRDLVSPEAQIEWGDRLQRWGYPAYLFSTQQKTGLDHLQTQLQQKITVISGPSGVGKSSLINQLIPDVDLRVGSVSGKLGRGRHTTRHVELFELPGGGLLADTPGFNQPDLDCAPVELADYFPEARQRLEEATCQFSNCLHRDEPNCAVRGDWERYEHYLVLLEEAIARQTQLHQTTDQDSSMKLKTNQKGESYYEPRLESKKYRRQSRRTQHQNLDAMIWDTEAEDD